MRTWAPSVCGELPVEAPRFLFQPSCRQDKAAVSSQENRGPLNFYPNPPPVHPWSAGLDEILI